MSTAFRLALADLRHEKLMALCTALAVAAVLAPLLVLAGLRNGVIEGLRGALLEDPRAREIISASNSTFSPDWLAQMRTRPDIAFIAPRTRALAATLLLERPDGSRQSRVELIPSDAGDPLLAGDAPQGTGLILSAPAAARLEARAGDVLIGKLGRILDGRRETLALEFRVQSVAPVSAFGRDGAFITLGVAVGLEDWQEGRGQLTVTADLQQMPARESFAGFRAYAHQIEDIPALTAMLRAQGIETVSRAEDVAQLLTLDRGLARLFMAIALVGGAGFLLSLGAGLWANVRRKHLSLAGLRLMGAQRGLLIVFPTAQAVILSGAGALLAVALAQTTAAAINAGFDIAAFNHKLCDITLTHCAIGVGFALIGALAASSLAAWHASTAEPFDAVRGP